MIIVYIQIDVLNIIEISLKKYEITASKINKTTAMTKPPASISKSEYKNEFFIDFIIEFF